MGETFLKQGRGPIHSGEGREANVGDEDMAVSRGATVKHQGDSGAWGWQASGRHCQALD